MIPPVELLQRLIQFDTTNPPGNEADCIAYLDGLLKEAGIQTTLVARESHRPNLIARLNGSGNAPPLLLYGHVDVVTTENQNWEQPPFSGIEKDGFIWGRGALDMKGGVAMLVSAFVQAKNLSLPGDLILALVSDEEGKSDYGAKYLVENHPQYFEGVQFALGEFGGFSLHLGDKKFYPIMVGERQSCNLKAILRGPAGHGAFPIRDGAMGKLGKFLVALDENRFPPHITPVVKRMLETMGVEIESAEMKAILTQLLNPSMVDMGLERLGDSRRFFEPQLRNTVSPTIVKGGNKLNVIPPEIEVTLDGRILPTFVPDDLLTELRQVVGDEVEIQITRYEPGPATIDMGMFDLLADTIKEADPDGIPIPLVISGATDARYFSRLGIQTYGFLPMNLPPDFNFMPLVHAANERIPTSAIQFGVDTLFQVLQQWGKQR
ncbi:MAG: M20/M25/M40 family metallo-hydrolase [Anaerolineae bacterium]|nr:M20/M25/M40 family metallo-hydrolase [Anaerolineae bacterium]